MQMLYYDHLVLAMKALDLTVREYIKRIRTLLQQDQFQYCTNIPQMMWIPAGIHEVLGTTISGRTTFVLKLASALLKKDIVPLFVDTTGKLSIEQIENSDIDPETLPVVNLSSIDEIKTIAMEKVITAIIVDEITPIRDKKSFMEDLAKIKSMRPEMLLIIVNQFRNDIVKKHKVPAHEAILYPYLNSRFIIRREEKKLGGMLTIISWYNMVGRKRRLRFSILQKNGTVPYRENILMTAISAGKARMIKRRVYVGNDTYTIPSCLKDDDFINRLTELVFEEEEVKEITQNLIRIKTGKRTSSFGVNVLMSADDEVTIHPTRVNEFSGLSEEEDDSVEKE